MPVRSAPDARWFGTQSKAAIVERGRGAAIARVKQMRTTAAFGSALRARAEAPFRTGLEAEGRFQEQSWGQTARRVSCDLVYT
jgi:hypothetical protein